MTSKFEKMHELSGKLAIASKDVINASALNLSSRVRLLEEALKEYDKEVLQLTKIKTGVGTVILL